MRTSLALSLAFITAGALHAAPQVGDSYEKVIAEKGVPAGLVEAGTTKILRYPDQTIKIKDGHVVSFESPAASVVQTSPSRPRTAGKPPTPTITLRTTWTTDYAAALDQAKGQGRHVFLFFTGSDWCGWCQRLNAEILSKPEFASYAGDNLVLVEIDFPRSKPQSRELIAQNAALARRYHIRGYPTVIVTDSSGEPLGELGYQEGGPAPFVAALSTM